MKKQTKGKSNKVTTTTIQKIKNVIDSEFDSKIKLLEEERQQLYKLHGVTNIKVFKSEKLDTNDLVASATIAKQLNISSQGMESRCKSRQVKRIKRAGKWFIKKEDLEKLN